MAPKHPTAKKNPHGWAGRSVAVQRMAALAFVVAMTAGTWMVGAEGESAMQRDTHVSWTEPVHDGQLTSVDRDMFSGQAQPTIKVEVEGREMSLNASTCPNPGKPDNASRWSLIRMIPAACWQHILNPRRSHRRCSTSSASSVSGASCFTC